MFTRKLFLAFCFPPFPAGLQKGEVDDFSRKVNSIDLESSLRLEFVGRPRRRDIGLPTGS